LVPEIVGESVTTGVLVVLSDVDMCCEGEIETLGDSDKVELGETDEDNDMEWDARVGERTCVSVATWVAEGEILRGDIVRVCVGVIEAVAECVVDDVVVAGEL
jgi:hypothetical protein